MAFPWDVPTLRDQQDFPKIGAVLNEMMRSRRLGELERARDPRLDGALLPEPYELIHPAGGAISFVPHVPQVDAKDALVRVHQGERIELKPGPPSNHRHHPEHSPGLIRGGRRSAKNSKSTCGREKPVALLERLAADRVEDEFDTPALSDLSRALFEVFGPIVDQVVDAKRAQFLMLGGGRRPNDLGADMLSDLGRGDTNPAARRMDQHRFAGLEAAHNNDELPGGEIVDRNRGAFRGGHAFGPREDPPRRRPHDMRAP